MKCLLACPVWHLLKITQLVCQLMWLAKMAGLTTAQDYSTSVNTSQVTQADVESVHHSAWFAICSGLLNWRVSGCGVYLPWFLVWQLLKIAPLVCQLMWQHLAMMLGVTTAQDYSTGMTMTTAWDYSTGVTTAWDYSTGVGVCFPWCLVWKLLKITQLVCQLMWHLLAIMPGVSSAQDYSTSVSADLASQDCSICLPWFLVS